MTHHKNHKNIVGAYEAKARWTELLQKVVGGEEITITRYGSPIAKLVPAKKKTTSAQRAAAIQRIQKLSQNLSLGGLKI